MTYWAIRIPGWAIAIATASIATATCADAASARLPGRCQGLTGPAYGICVSFCEAHQCYTLPDRSSCQVLRSAFQKLTRRSVFPCEVVAPPTRTQTPLPTSTPTPTPGVFVYWDQNEEEDAIAPGGHPVQLVAPWDPNGQMCIFPDSSSRAGQFVTGYNPTLPSQHNLGGTLPYKNPPVGMAVWDRHGNFTGQTIYVPGPYALPGTDAHGDPLLGGDIPPDEGSTFCTDGVTTGHCTTDAECLPGSHCSGTFNNNGSFTGCAFDSKGDLFAADIGQSQGSTPLPQGRIIEWFPPDYTSYCIIIGPTALGDGPHHVNGTGGLRNPGTMAVDPEDNLYVPETGASRVLRFDHSVLPNSAAECGADGLLSPSANYSAFITGIGPVAGIALDPSCSTDTQNCWAVSNILAGSGLGNFNTIYWFVAAADDTSAMPFAGKGPVPPGDFTAFGLSVAPAGDVYFVSTGLTCTFNPINCDTVDDGGALYHVTFTNGVPSVPEKIASGLNFPVSATTCDASEHICPEPVLDATPVVQPTATGGG